MDKIKSLLLPLALVFGAIAVFELGARYGASNTRAIALTAQLNNFVNLYKQIGPRADAQSMQNLEAAIDNHLVTAALERKAWYLQLKDEPKASLEKALAAGLLVRGDATLLRFQAMQNPSEESESKINPARLVEIIRALETAQDELLQKAPEVETKQAVTDQTPE